MFSHAVLSYLCLCFSHMLLLCCGGLGLLCLAHVVYMSDMSHKLPSGFFGGSCFVLILQSLLCASALASLSELRFVSEPMRSSLDNFPHDESLPGLFINQYGCILQKQSYRSLT